MSVVVEPWAHKPQGGFERLLGLTGARPDMAICTAGQGDVALMLKLCHDGYERVECLKRATCTCADGGVDVLLIPGEAGAGSVVAVLTRTVRVLRDGGMVALKLASAGEAGGVKAALAALGLSIQVSATDPADETLVAFTVRHAAPIAIAA